jgi:hypothetical protein
VIISNCVINLSPDKDAVFAESFRVLKPGGRMRVADIVWSRPPSDSERDDLASWAGCIAGALEIDQALAKLNDAGFVDVRIEPAGDAGKKGWVSANISATKPAAQEPCCGPGCC